MRRLRPFLPPVLGILTMMGLDLLGMDLTATRTWIIYMFVGIITLPIIIYFEYKKEINQKLQH